MRFLRQKIRDKEWKKDGKNLDDSHREYMDSRSEELNNYQFKAEERFKMLFEEKYLELQLLCNYPIGARYYCDFVELKHKLIIEIDEAYHNTKKQRVKDRRRDQFLTRKGYKILRLKTSETNLEWLYKVKDFFNIHIFKITDNPDQIERKAKRDNCMIKQPFQPKTILRKNLGT